MELLKSSPNAYLLTDLNYWNAERRPAMDEAVGVGGGARGFAVDLTFENPNKNWKY